MPEVRLPGPDGAVSTYHLSGRDPYPRTASPPRSRVAFAAAHVVADPMVEADPFEGGAIDWDVTLAFRRHLWGLGLSVAEAMDTAQRGMGLSWPQAAELIRRSAAEARATGGVVACGIGTDHLTPGPSVTTDDVVAAYLEQVAVAEDAGAPAIVMASRALAACARGPEDYLDVYDRVLSQLSEPAILHWLGEPFDPALAGYWGHADTASATDVCLQVLSDHATRIRGIKVSLLDLEHEVGLRQKVPEDVVVFTGDDFNFKELIRGDGQHHSDALLGIFDAAAPAAAAALAALDRGDVAGYEAILEPVVELSRHLFRAPTRYYKTGVVALAHLNGHQDHLRMLGGLEGARSTLHLARLFVLADAAGLLDDPELAAARMTHVMAVSGVT